MLISDANILIDLEEGQLLELFFHLPYQFKVPDILFEELKADHGHLTEPGNAGCAALIRPTRCGL